MNRWHVFALGIGLFTMTSCTKVERVEVEPPPPPETPAPTPPPTPHPAVAARERAIQLYPDLAVKDSLFHRTFMELFDEAKQRQPQELTTIDWPIILAHRAGHMLGIAAAPRATPAPSTPVTVFVTPKLGSSLDRKAYDSKRGVTQTPALINR